MKGVLHQIKVDLEYDQWFTHQWEMAWWMLTEYLAAIDKLNEPK